MIGLSSQGTHNDEGIQNSKCPLHGIISSPIIPHVGPFTINAAAATSTYTCSIFSQCHIRLIKWTDEGGDIQQFYLIEKISHKWRDIGELESISMKYRGDTKECCRAVLGQWLDNPPPDYPTILWQGLIELLEDSRLGQVASELRKVLVKLH